MGVNNEYGADAFQYEDAHEEDYQEDYDLELDPPAWHDWHSEHILNMWMSLRAYLEDNGMSSTLLNKATFHKFCEFVRNNSS
jgi:hypothetical protein